MLDYYYGLPVVHLVPEVLTDLESRDLRSALNRVSKDAERLSLGVFR